jgi:hypothetical protein
VESEQNGLRRGAYGAGILKSVSERLAAEYGSGFSVSGLQYMRAFYVEYPEFLIIQHAPRGISDKLIHHPPSNESWQPGRLNPNLSWTHYRTLRKAKRNDVRSFYEIEIPKWHFKSEKRA